MFAKRPIYNQQLKCVAFEVLSSEEAELDEEQAHNLLDLIHHSDGHLPLFIPFSFKAFIESIQPPLQNPVILKLPAEEIESHYSVDELKNSLFSIALLIDTPQQLAWLNLAEYIGLTEHLMSGSDLTKVVKYSKDKHRKVIAYSLAHPLNFEKCKQMTMDYYCGDFLFKPLEEGEEIAANKLNLLQLIQKIQLEDCDLNAISSIIQTDPLLTFQLLKVANSVGFSGSTTISSIDQAVARLGLINLKNWVMLFSMKNISDKPLEILESGLIRAYMAQELAKTTTDVSGQTAYTVGLLSILDCLLNKPMDKLIKQIALPKTLVKALLHQEGPLGEILGVVTAYEAGNWDKIPHDGFNGVDLSKLYIDSLNLVSQNVKAIRA